jgi:hypothetical protein
MRLGVRQVRTPRWREQFGRRPVDAMKRRPDRPKVRMCALRPLPVAWARALTMWLPRRPLILADESLTGDATGLVQSESIDSFTTQLASEHGICKNVRRE